MKLKVDEKLCTGHGRCYSEAPELFTDDERGYARVVGDGRVTPDRLDAARRSVTLCPERAISLVEDE